MTSNDIYTTLSSKPHNPHYLDRYWKFIQHFQHQTKIKDITEHHHICPKSKDLFPEYSKLTKYVWNGVHLTTRQHFIAHALLSKSYGGCQIYAYWAMCHKMSNGEKRQYKINSYMFEQIKSEYKERNKVTNPFNNPTIQNNIKEKNFERYGVYNVFKSEEIKTKIKETNLKNLGVEYAMQCQEVQQKSKATNLKNLGVQYPMQSLEVQKKSKEKCLEIYGVEHASQSPIIKQKIKETNLKNLGVEHNSQFKFLSIIDTKKTYAKNSLSRWYPEFRQYY